MKTFKTIGMACLAIAASINFTACGDDDDAVKNENGSISKQKRPKEIKTYFDDEDEEGELFTFSYDANGRLTRVTEGWEPEQYIINFTWGNNIITAVSKYSDSDGETETNIYTLEDNLIKTQKEREWMNNTFTYNSSEQIIKMKANDMYSSPEKDESYELDFTWNNGKITKIVDNSSYTTSIYELTYNGKTYKGWFLPFFYVLDRELDYINWAHPELFGERMSQLPESIKETYYNDNELISEEKSKMDYTFDEEGYVKSLTIISTYTSRQDQNGDGIITDDEIDTSTEKAYMTFEWE